jgi:hypothetical protein
MVKLEPIRPPIQLRRSWLIFFSEGEPGFWRFFTRRGFRHVDAAAYFADQDRWVFIIPERKRLVVEVKRPDEAGHRLAHMRNNATAAVRFNGQEARRFAPIGVGCVGIVKGMLGIKSRALVPFQLYADLLRQGAEVIDVPIFHAGTPTGRPGSSETARGGGATREAGPDQGSAGAVAA